MKTKNLFKILVVLSLFSAMGCSWIGVNRVSEDWKPCDPLQCTSGRTAPVLDIVSATLGFLTTILGIAIAAGDSCRDISGPILYGVSIQQCVNKERAIGIILGTLAFTAIFTTSGMQGFQWTEKCRETLKVRKSWEQTNEREHSWVAMKTQIAKEGIDRLGLAVSLFQEGTIRSLIERGADVNQRDSSGRTPLHWAVEEKKPKVIALLASMGANMNVGDELGWTPLHYAALSSRPKIISHPIDIDGQVKPEHISLTRRFP